VNTKRVIIVDDDQFYVNLVSKIFIQRGWQTVICSSMETALQSYNPKHVSLIVTDIFMPGMGGIEGIKFLRQTFPDSSIIAMSGGWDGMSPKATVDAAIKIGADAGLKKPITPEELDHVLGTLNIP
jgi:CheY-like chemotaxis protein